MSTGLYVHIPYCKQKCKYCSFFSKPSDTVEERYFSHLIEEIEGYASENVKIDTIYIGGGTPSLLSKEQVTELFETIRKTFEVEENAEVSIELNPESASEELFIHLKKCGVNRVSFGVQSFNDDELKAIGRLHDEKTASEKITLAGKYFDNINLDLMIGLPYQTKDTFSLSLSKALTLPIKHISIYSLIVEENTQIFKMIEEGLQLPDDDETVEMYDLAERELSEHSFHRYEISNFAKSGFECKHNLNCWKFKEYIGVGASAHSFFKDERFSNQDNLENFSDINNRIIYKKSGDDRISEYIMLALRTAKGINKSFFKNRFGIDFDERFSNVLEKSEIKITCENEKDNFKIKDEFLYVSNSIIVDFLEEI